MYDRRLVAAAAAVALMVAGLVATILVMPRVAAQGLAELAQSRLGRSLALRGGSHLDFSPLALRLDDVALSGPSAGDDSFVIAREAVIPLGLSQLFGAAPDVASLALGGADIALIVNERGEASWEVPGVAPAGPLSVSLDQARLRYFDARNGQGMELSQVDGRLDIGGDGGLRFAGTAVINGRVVRIDADLKSLARVNADGSPLELALAADDGAASFSGRLSTAKVLSLAGPVSLSSDRPAAGLRLLGLPVVEGAAIPGPIAIDGALDTAGRAYAIRNATFSLGGFTAVGEIGADLRNATPKLQANLTADRVALDQLLPAAGARNGDWGRAPLPFDLLRQVDVEAGLALRGLSYGGFTSGGASLKLSLAAGKLQLDGLADLAADGTLSFTARADATAVPPSAGLTIAASDGPAQPLLGALTGATALTGTGGFAADLSATGTTQEELIGTMKGTASLDYVNGAIAGVDLTGLMLTAKHKIVSGWADAPGNTAFTRLAGEAKVEDGIASFRGATLEGTGSSFSFEGLVDVLRQAIAISAAGSANGQPLLPVPVIAKGPWAGPKIYPDVPNILGDPQAGFSKLQGN